MASAQKTERKAYINMTFLKYKVWSSVLTGEQAEVTPTSVILDVRER